MRKADLFADQPYAEAEIVALAVAWHAEQEENMPQETNPLYARLDELEAEVARLSAELAQYAGLRPRAELEARAAELRRYVPDVFTTNTGYDWCYESAWLRLRELRWVLREEQDA